MLGVILIARQRHPLQVGFILRLRLETPLAEPGQRRCERDLESSTKF